VVLAIGGEGVLVAVKIAAVVTFLSHVSTCGSTKCIELRVELRLGFDEGATVVTHGLVTSIWVLRDDGITRGDQDQQKQDESERSIDDEENQAQDPSDKTLIRSVRCWQ